MSHKFTLKEGHSVQEIVICGETYYEFTDANMSPCYRMFQAMTFYNELQMRCDRDYLMAHSQALIDCINGQSETAKGYVDVVKISQLATQLKERVEWIFEPDAVFKYASVIMFDENENPYDYDMKYNMDVKIKKWKEMDISSFFLSMPVKKLFPLLNLSSEDLVEYLKVQGEISKAHWEVITGMLSSNSKMTNWYKSLTSQKQGE
jgi:hypothetical protein